MPLQSRILFARTDINCAARLVGEMNERVSVLKRGFVPIRRSDQPMTTGTHATDNVIFFRDDDAIVSPAVLVKIGKISLMHFLRYRLLACSRRSNLVR